MLDSIRSFINTWPARLLLGLLIVGLAAFGLTGVFNTDRANVVATVGRTDIQVEDFRQQYNAQIQAYATQLGLRLTPQDSMAFGVPYQVLAVLVNDATLLESARRMGLGISDDWVANEIARALTPDGESFDPNALRTWLAQNNVSERTVIADSRDQILRSQIQQGLFGGFSVPQTLLDAMSRFNNEVRTISYAAINASHVTTLSTPTDAELELYHAAHPERFSTEAMRSVAVLELSPALVVNPEAVSAAEVRAQYDRTALTAHTTPERRHVRQVTFPNAAAAAEARAAIDAGAILDDVVTAAGGSLSVIDLGMVTRGEVVVNAIGNAAFALEAGQVSQPVSLPAGGVSLVEVRAIVPAVTRPFEEVEAEIRNALALAAAQRSLAPLYGNVLDELAGGARLLEVGQRLGIPVRVIDAVDRFGNDPDGQPVNLPGNVGSLVFATFLNIPSAAEPTTANSYLWYEVLSEAMPTVQPFEEVVETVRASWRAEETAARALALATGVRDRVREGLSFADALADMGLAAPVVASGPLTRASVSPALGPTTVAAVFAGSGGSVEVAAGPNGDQIVFEITGIAVPEADPITAQSSANQIAGQMQTGLASYYVQQLQRRWGALVNDNLLNQAIGLI